MRSSLDATRFSSVSGLSLTRAGLPGPVADLGLPKSLFRELATIKMTRDTTDSSLPFCSGYLLLALIASFFGTLPVCAQQQAPAVPLVAHSPYFSIWSVSDTLNGTNTRHWTGSEQRLSGLLRLDGKTYRYMGADPQNVPAMKQVSLRISPLHTDYAFEEGGARLQVTFFTPALPSVLNILSRPVTYLTWTLRSTDGRPHSATLLLDVSSLVAVNSPDQEMTWESIGVISIWRCAKVTTLRPLPRVMRFRHSSNRAFCRPTMIWICPANREMARRTLPLLFRLIFLRIKI